MEQPVRDVYLTPSILLVDDEVNILNSLVRLLKPLKYTIHTALNAEVALDLLSQHPVDLVISDMRMPGMDGAEFLKQATEINPDLVSILLTGHADIQEAVRAVNEGNIFKYLNKPWDNQELIEYIDKALEKKLLQDFTQQHLAETTSRARDLYVDNKSLHCTMHAVQTENDGFLSELNRGRNIQARLLPTYQSDLPVWGFNLPINILSGDFYDYFKCDDKLYFYLGDVAGKGVNASLVMAKVNGLFRSLAKQYQDLTTLVNTLNAELLEQPIPGMFITMAGGVYDYANKTLEVFNAGHIPICIQLRDSTAVTLEALTIPLGIQAEFDCETKHYANSAKTLFVYSDGLDEINKTEDSNVSEIDVQKCIERSHTMSLAQRIRYWEDLVQSLRDKAHDDLTILLVDIPD